MALFICRISWKSLLIRKCCVAIQRAYCDLHVQQILNKRYSWLCMTAFVCLSAGIAMWQPLLDSFRCWQTHETYPDSSCLSRSISKHFGNGIPRPRKTMHRDVSDMLRTQVHKGIITHCQQECRVVSLSLCRSVRIPCVDTSSGHRQYCGPISLAGYVDVVSLYLSPLSVLLQFAARDILIRGLFLRLLRLSAAKFHSEIHKRITKMVCTLWCSLYCHC